ncbi:hypothetical protein CR513_01373, partial [Mucuna pruriens]
MEEGTSRNDSSSASINDNDIYLQVVRCKNEKGIKFMHLTRISTNLIEMSMVQHMEEMRKTIHKLNNELIEKEAKEKSLEDKVVQLLHSHEEQSEQIRQ